MWQVNHSSSASRERISSQRGIQEHHGFYHPGYMGWPLAYQAYAALMDEALPSTQRDPQVYLNNLQTDFAPASRSLDCGLGKA